MLTADANRRMAVWFNNHGYRVSPCKCGDPGAHLPCSACTHDGHPALMDEPESWVSPEAYVTFNNLVEESSRLFMTDRCVVRTNALGRLVTWRMANELLVELVWDYDDNAPTWRGKHSDSVVGPPVENSPWFNNPASLAVWMKVEGWIGG